MPEPLTDAMVDDLVSRGAYKSKAFQIVEAGNSRGWTFRRCLGQMWKYGRRPLLDQIVTLRSDLATAQSQVNTLVPVGRLYLDAVDADPELEMVTLVEAYRLTEVREVVETWEASR